jgi:hypothetical protein
MSALLFLLAGSSGAVDLYNKGTLEEIDVILAVAGILVGMLGLLADLIVAQSRR